MNIVILFGFLFLLFPLNNSFGTTQILDENIFVFVQTTVRNADGQLVLYLESTKFTDLNLPALESFLDFESLQFNDPVITVGDTQYQVIRRVQTQNFDENGLAASTMLHGTVDGESVLLVRFAHDGYLTTLGDTMESVWTFVRPLA